MDRSQLASRIDQTCRLTGTFTLRSGQTATEYFDKYLVMGARFTIDLNGQQAEIEHTVNTIAQYVRIIIDTVTHGHPTEQPPQDDEGWTPLNT